MLTRLVALTNTAGLSFLVRIKVFKNNHFLGFACTEIIDTCVQCVVQHCWLQPCPRQDQCAVKAEKEKKKQQTKEAALWSQAQRSLLG